MFFHDLRRTGRLRGKIGLVWLDLTRFLTVSFHSGSLFHMLHSKIPQLHKNQIKMCYHYRMERTTDPLRDDETLEERHQRILASDGSFTFEQFKLTYGKDLGIAAGKQKFIEGYELLKKWEYRQDWRYLKNRRHGLSNDEIHDLIIRAHAAKRKTLSEDDPSLDPLRENETTEERHHRIIVTGYPFPFEMYRKRFDTEEEARKKYIEEYEQLQRWRYREQLWQWRYNAPSLTDEEIHDKLMAGELFSRGIGSTPPYHQYFSNRQENQPSAQSRRRKNLLERIMNLVSGSND
jgi:hypothetical protein